MKISVITVCYNSVNSLERTILSVKNQDWINKEHLIIDGKSNDGTAEILKKYATDLSYVISEPDDGIYSAMNKGLLKVSGDIICFLNADDFYVSNSVLSTIVKVMGEDHLDMVYGDINYFHPKNHNHITRKYLSKNFTKSKFAYGIMPAHPATFIQKKIIDYVGFFDTTFRIAGDFDFLTRVFSFPNLRHQYIPQVLVLMQSGGISNKNLFNQLKINQEILKACKKNKIKTNLFKILLRYPKKILEKFF